MATPNPRRGGPRATAQEEAQPMKAEEDLNQVLSTSQRRELIALVKCIMDEMQEILCHPSEHYIDPTPDSPDRSNAQNPEALPPRQETQQLQSSRAGTSIKLEAFDYFKSWKQSVLGRLGEAIETSGSPEKQPPRPMDPIEPEAAPVDPKDRASISNRTEYPDPFNPHLKKLPMETRLLITNSFLLLLLSLKSYNAHSRALLLKLSTNLGISAGHLAENEIKVAQGLLKAAKEMSASDEAKARADESKASRRWKIGLASVAGAVLVGVTGGLAAPVVAGGVGMIMGTLGLGGTVAAGYLGAVAGSGVVIGSIFGAFGARMTGRMMEKSPREVRDFAFLPLRAPPAKSENETVPSTIDTRLQVTIGISGWLTEPYDLVNPWRVLGKDSDVFALRWELQALLMLGNAMESLVRRFALTFAAQQLLNKTILAPFSGPLMIPMVVLKLSHLVDNPFNVAKTRAEKAGEILADALINKAQGERPVTLIGYSMGARVIYACLLSLAKRRAFGMVESAILIGSPTPSDTAQWRLIRTVVSGRLVNVYSKNDLMLRFLYRSQSVQMNVAGIQPIENVPELENLDASKMVPGHLRYPLLVGAILEKIGFDHLDQDELRRQADRLRALAAEDERLVDQAQREEQQHEPAQVFVDSNALDRDQKCPEEPPISNAEIQNLEDEITRRTEDSLVEIHMQSIHLEDREGQQNHFLPG
ncbi:DUF726 family protein [Coccidioides immitis RMSCC 2394]|uniref:DUF726 family protein n=1 Tax=Coccidioides immitis RMSCC 2394 TaxID=404692 RepID=A0A0J6YE74_COCIT|nr:DUF726 family protein [Coccidioides immitis RMSCC 2394]